MERSRPKVCCSFLSTLLCLSASGACILNSEFDATLRCCNSDCSPLMKHQPTTSLRQKLAHFRHELWFKCLRNASSTHGSHHSAVLRTRFAFLPLSFYMHPPHHLPKHYTNIAATTALALRLFFLRYRQIYLIVHKTRTTSSNIRSSSVN